MSSYKSEDADKGEAARTATSLSAATYIRELNDALRQTFIGGRVLVTPGVRELPLADNVALLNAVRIFSDFDKDNDPRGEHDFGSVELAGQTWFFKIDYYDKACEFGSEDPSDPERTTRVLTIMRADEY
jgi:hypothetical protein